MQYASAYEFTLPEPNAAYLNSAPRRIDYTRLVAEVEATVTHLLNEGWSAEEIRKKYYSRALDAVLRKHGFYQRTEKM